ncbi:MAG: hypothetical protein HYY44_06970, partial [Deltaproteobacteria bacterium]|nr:hypothetical protein [Deltaproteobacteria bacterium]
DDDCSCFTAVAKDWFAVVAGNGHTLAIKAVNPEDTFGTLWGWGRNDEGQVGDGLISHKKRPVQISSAGWAMIAAGGKASLAVKADGTLWGWGDNSQSQLTTIISKVPKQIGVDQDWVEVSLGLNHAAGIRLVAGQRQLFVWGKNDAKQLGLPAPNGNKQVVKQPTQVPDISGTQWMKVFAGNRFTLAITGDGRLFAWGNNEHGQLGLGSGTVGTNVATPMQVGGATNWASVAPGGGHVVVLNSGKELFTWGDNTHGQLGTGTTGGIVDSPPASPLLSNVKSITASWNSSFAVKGDNTVLSWGSNFKSALGRSTTGDDANPTLIAATAGGVSVVGNLITAGPFHPLVIDTTDQTKGRIFGWGDNSFGQLGLGDGISKQEVPAAVTGGVLDCSAAGQIDEDFVSQSTTCGTGACASSGTTSCSNGTEANSCTPTLPSVSTDTTCDGVDNDCSGTADEDYVATSTTCGVGACAGNTGSLTCVSGSTQDSCDPTIGAGSEVCGNGIDENCNGSDLSCNDVDQDGDGFTPNGGDCNDNNAAIKPGATEICDGLDNDCDSPTQIDEKLGIVFGASKFGRAVFGENCGFTFP